MGSSSLHCLPNLIGKVIKQSTGITSTQKIEKDIVTYYYTVLGNNKANKFPRISVSIDMSSKQCVLFG
jgi:hypothetical protein